MRRAGALVLALLWLAPAAAQEPPTRRDALRQLRLEKAQQLAAYRPGRIERWLVRVENDRLLEQLSLTSAGGWYVRTGSVTPGGGFAAGPAYRRRAVGDRRVDLSASAAVSSKKYWVGEAAAALPRLADGHAFVRAYIRRRDFPQEDFFGVGQDSARADRVSFTYRDASFGASGGRQVRPWLTAAGGVEYLAARTGAGRDPRFPSIEALFGDPDAPGLFAPARFVRYEGSLDLDYGEPEGNPRRGGRYLAAWNYYDDVGSGRYSFQRFDVDARQYLSFLKARRVIALRSLLSMSSPREGHTVPFYLQRTLGGSSTLRGYREYRFRDRHLLLLQAEYRWEIFPALDAALFYDAGKVAARAADLDLRGLETSYGFGFRFGTNRGVFLRLDTGLGSREGPHVFMKFGHVF